MGRSRDLNRDERIIDAYQGIETRRLTCTRAGETEERIITLRIFRWRDGAVIKEGNALAFAAFLGVDVSIVHQTILRYGGEAERMRPGTKGLGRGSHDSQGVIREDIIDEEDL